MRRSSRSAEGEHRFFRLALLGTVWIASMALAAQTQSEPVAAVKCSQRQDDVVIVGSFRFRSYENEKNGQVVLQVSRDSKVVYLDTKDGGFFTLGQAAELQWGIPGIANGTDISGRGHPDMIVSYYSGGAHCCTTHYVFELEPQFRLLATLEDGNSSTAHFVDLDHNHRYCYLSHDDSFAYWRSSYAGSPAPKVILCFVDDSNGGRYRLALDKMQQPAPTLFEWDVAAEQTRASFGDSTDPNDLIGSDLWANMLTLIYTGHPELAWKLFDGAWPAKRPRKNEFLNDFCLQIRTSPYWSELEKSIQDMPAACESAKSDEPGK